MRDDCDGYTMTQRKRLAVTRDSDGGLTIHDPQSDLVVSLIATHPDASGPHGLTIEVYAYDARFVLAQGIPPRGSSEAIALRIEKHPTTAYYPENRKRAEA